MTALQFEWSSSTPSDFRSFLQSSLVPVLISKFNEFPKQLVAANGNDIAPVSPGASGATTPVATKYSPAPPGEVRAKAAAEQKLAGSGVVNTATVTVEARLQASAHDMYAFMTDERRIPMWSRSAAKVGVFLRVGRCFPAKSTAMLCR